MRGRNHVAVIQYQPTLQDDFTGTGGEWTTFAECFGDLRPLRGRELFDAQQVQSQVSHSFETEFVPGVTSQMRVRVARVELVNEDEPDNDANFRIFEIDSALNVNEANRSLELMLIEKV